MFLLLTLNKSLTQILKTNYFHNCVAKHCVKNGPNTELFLVRIGTIFTQYKYTNDSDITRKALIFLLETICVLLKYIQVNEVSDNA